MTKRRRRMSGLSEDDDDHANHTDRKLATAYEVAGRGDISHTFKDFRSIPRARQRISKENDKYYNYIGVKSGQLGLPHHTPNPNSWSGYNTLLPETETTIMTKKLLYAEAQHWPKPLHHHRSPGSQCHGWRKEVRRIAKRYRGVFSEIDFERALTCEYRYRRHEKDDEVCSCQPGEDDHYWCTLCHGYEGEEGVYNDRARCLDWEELDASKVWPATARERTQRARRDAAKLKRAPHSGADATVDQVESKEMLHLALDTAGYSPLELDGDPKEWFELESGFCSDNYESRDDEDYDLCSEAELVLCEASDPVMPQRWSWYQDEWSFGILIEGTEAVGNVIEHLVAGYRHAIARGAKVQDYRVAFFKERDLLKDFFDQADHRQPSSDDDISEDNDWTLLNGAPADDTISDAERDDTSEEWDFVDV